jgi:hypothetical protein
MGLNFDINVNRCDCCGRSDELHVGMVAHGWRAMIQTVEGDAPSPYPRTWDAWKALLTENDGALTDEYGEVVPSAEFIATCEARANEASHVDIYGGGRKDGPVDLLDHFFT